MKQRLHRTLLEPVDLNFYRMHKSTVLPGQSHVETPQVFATNVSLLLQDVMFGSDALRQGVTEIADEFTFKLLADTWRRETGHYSILQQKILHPAYQEIIGMGERALPFLIKELDSKPSHWFWALRSITRENPAQQATTPQDAVKAWKEWWENRLRDIWQTGYLVIENKDFRILIDQST